MKSQFWYNGWLRVMLARLHAVGGRLFQPLQLTLSISFPVLNSVLRGCRPTPANPAQVHTTTVNIFL